MSHTCHSLILHCMDFRFGKDLKTFMEEHALIGDADEVAFAGAAKNFTEKKSKTFAMRQIDIASRLHHVCEVHLVNHLDCGAYGGRDAFASAKEERKAHLRDLRAAADAIKNAHQDIHVRGWLASIDETQTPAKIEFEEIALQEK